MDLFWKKQNHRQAIPREEKCRIKVKRNSDGSYTKEISGKCTKEQLEALSQQSDTPLSINE